MVQPKHMIDGTILSEFTSLLKKKTQNLRFSQTIIFYNSSTQLDPEKKIMGISGILRVEGLIPSTTFLTSCILYKCVFI